MRIKHFALKEQAQKEIATGCLPELKVEKKADTAAARSQGAKKTVDAIANNSKKTSSARKSTRTPANKIASGANRAEAISLCHFVDFFDSFGPPSHL